MKLLITGAPGTGKTALVTYANKLGFTNFFDTDEVHGLCEWRNYATGKVLGDVEIVNPEGGDLWYKTNGWYWKTKAMNKLMESVKNPVICGSADNVMDFYKQFDAIILLYKNREDIIKNLSQPERDQANGKDPSHHDRILQWQEKLFASLTSFNPYIVRDNTVAGMFNAIATFINR